MIKMNKKMTAEQIAAIISTNNAAFSGSPGIEPNQRGIIKDTEISQREHLFIEVYRQAVHGVNSSINARQFVNSGPLLSVVHYNNAKYANKKFDWQMAIIVCQTMAWDSYNWNDGMVYSTDLVNVYNAYYKIKNGIHWSMRNGLAHMLNTDPSSVHSHGGVVMENISAYMAEKTGKSIDDIKRDINDASIGSADLIRYLRFINRMRAKRAGRRAAINPNNNTLSSLLDSGKTTREVMLSRIADAYSIIASCSPANHERRLSGLSKMLAKRYFPNGSLYGIELEFGCEDESNLVGMDADDYPKMPFVSFKGDGSIGSANGDGMCVGSYQEVNILLSKNEANGWDRLKKVVDWLNNNGAMVNATCGMHVHFDTRHLGQGAYTARSTKMLNAYRNWAKYAVSPSRAYGNYCNIETAPRNRYSAINTCSRAKFNTLEVRIGHGTLNYNKIRAWVAFNEWLFNAPTKHTGSFEAFMASDCDPLIKAFMMSRIIKFADKWHERGDNKPKEIKSYVEMASDSWRV